MADLGSNVKRRTLLSCAAALFALVSLPSANINARDVTPHDRKTIGLVLSGGGARGAAHVGVIKILDELRIPVDYIAGTSMGAIVGGLYASGMSSAELTQVFDTVDWSTLLTDRPPRGRRSFRRKSDDSGFLVNFDLGVDSTGLIFPSGIVQGQNFELALKRLTLPAISIDDFDELPIPFRAVATDIVSGEAVVLGSGDLATAMRASMSAPGVFRPVRINERILVDGGVANNLPVQVVRDLGADILIVVDVGFPLLPEEQLGSALALTKQMLTILINARARDQIALLTADDILISPALGDLGSQDFQRLGEAQQIGERQARKLLDRLAKLSVSDEEYRDHRIRLAHKRQDLPVIEQVVVQNESKLSPEVIASRLREQAGGPLDVDRLESDLADVYGFDTFETVSYDVHEDPAGNTLTVTAREKSWGPNYLRFGINLEDNFDGDSDYNIATRFTRTEINRRGGELRAELQIGETPHFFAEFYQPLDYASRWFVNPIFAFERSGSSLFEDGGQLARFRSRQIQLSLEGGRQFGNWGEIRVGIARSHSREKVLIGPPGFESASSDLANLFASFGYDTIDSFSIPRFGTNVTLGWFGAREILGTDSRFDIASVFFLKPQTWGNHTLLHWWDFASTVSDDTPGLQPFTLGGLFSLSGRVSEELTGSRQGIGRLLYYRRLGDAALPGVGMPIYLGASIEAGNVWADSSDISLDNTLVSGSVFLMLDTLIGPLYLAYGAGEGGRRSAYLFLGQTF